MSRNSRTASADEAAIEPEKAGIAGGITGFPDQKGQIGQNGPHGALIAPDASDETGTEPDSDLGTDLEPDARAGSEPGAGNALDDEEILRAVTALVFASPEPISPRRLAALLEGPEIGRVEAALNALRDRLAACGLPLELRQIAGGFQILTAPEMGVTIQRLFKARKAERISTAALETLAVVAYRQPVTKAEIEAIRGVQAGPILRSLIDRGLARVTGRADVPGHPLQYGTTRTFLDRFGLASLEDLPRDAELSKD